MNALQEVIHSARELVNEHRHAYPPVWAKDANKIIDEAAAELASLRAHVGELERDLESGFMQGAYARLKNLQEAERERDELRNIVAAQIVEWKYRVENQPMPTDRQIGIDMCANELSAALAKEAK